MTAAPRTHWAELAESTSVVGIGLLYGIHRLFGRLPFRLVLWPVVATYWARNRIGRAASGAYLARVGRPSGPGATLAHFVSFAETMLDKLLAVSGRYPFDTVRIEGREPFEALVAEGVGGVLVTAHFGCVELAQALGERDTAVALTVLVHTRHAERFNALLRRLRPTSTVRLLQVTEVTAATGALLAERVAAGEWVVVAGDRVPVSGPGGTAIVDFLGAPAAFPVGPWVIASALRCPVFLLACFREGDHHVVRFEPFADRLVLDRRDRARDLHVAVARFAGWLERLCRRAPLEWFNFFPFWLADPAEGADVDAA